MELVRKPFDYRVWKFDSNMQNSKQLTCLLNQRDIQMHARTHAMMLKVSIVVLMFVIPSGNFNDVYPFCFDMLCFTVNQYLSICQRTL